MSCAWLKNYHCQLFCVKVTDQHKVQYRYNHSKYFFQEAPAVARACLLLECCLLVHKCNQGEWPQWLRGSLPSLAHRRGGHSPTAGSPFMFAQRRNLVAMHEAGVLFRAWGVALGKKLEQVLAKKRRKMLPSIEEEGGKPVITDEEDVEEDFLDEGTVQL